MATKKLDVVVAASSTGVAGVVQDLDRISQAARKAGGGQRSFGQQAAALGIGGDSSVASMLRGGGAAIVLSQFAHALQGVPEAIGHMRESVAAGDSRLRAFGEVIVNTIPVIGELRQGILDAADAFDDFVTGRDRKKEEATEEERRRNERAEGKARVSLLRRLQNQNKASGDEAELIGLDSFDKDRKVLTRKFNEFVKQQDKDEQLIKTLPGPQQEAMKAALSKRFDDETAIYVEKNHQITAMEQDQQNERSHALAVAQFQFRQFFRDLETNAKAFVGRAGDTIKQAFRDKFFQSEEFNRDVMGMRADVLGGMGMKTEAEGAKVQETIASRRLDIQKRLTDPLLDQGQKTLLEQMFKQLPALEREMLSNIGKEPVGPNRAQLENTRFLTGVGSKDVKIEKNTAEAARWAKMLYDFLRTKLGPAGAGETSSVFGGT